MKKILFLALCFAMLLAIVPFSAFNVAAAGFVDNGVKYVLSDDGTYYYVDDCMPATTEATILSSYNGIPVTQIDSYAFEDCSSLQSIEIPDSVTTIGDWAFYNCTSLENVVIPENAVLDGSIFYGCTKISFTEYNGGKYYGTESNPYQILYETLSTDITTFTIHNNTNQIAGSAFDYCTSLQSIEIPDSVTTIGDSAFSLCTSLESIEIPDSVITIGNSAFSFCASLTSIEIPNSVTTISNYAFYECTSLESIEIPDSVTTIGWSAFYNCSDSLINITVSSNNEYYHSKDNCLIETSTNTLLLGCKNSIIPNYVTTIGSSAFYECTSLESIEIPDSVTIIGDYAFSNCESLQSVVIPDSVTSIGDYAFYECKSLTSIVIPDSVTTIDYYAFYGCSFLMDIYCEASSKPSGWSSVWNYGCDATIHWGYVKPEITTGDINGNDKIDMSDYVLLKRAYFGTFNFSEEQNTAGDINKNGKLDMADYVLLKRAYFGTYVIG